MDFQILFYCFIRYRKNDCQRTSPTSEHTYENTNVDGVPDNATSLSELSSTYIGRPEVGPIVVPQTDGAYEIVSHNFCKKSDNELRRNSLDDIAIKVEDDNKEAHYSPLRTYENIPRNTNDKVLVNEYEILKKHPEKSCHNDYLQILK